VENQKIDARGLSCPQPVLLTRQAISGRGGGTIEILVDSVASCENIRRLAQTSGWEVTIEETAVGDYRVMLQR
jgi:tRNA 2-thiouridine synthesizing protein A